MYGDASGDIGDLSGNFSDAGGGGGVTGYSSGDYGQNVFGALDRALAGEDLDRGSLEALSALGLGKVDISPTQNVEQALASRNVHNVLNYAAPALASLVPGYGMVSNIGKGIAGIHGLMTGRLSAEEVVPGLAAGLIGARTGIPSGIVEGIITGDLGKTVGSGAQAGLGALVGGLTGSPFAGALASSTLGPAVGRAASEAVGGTKSGGPGGLFGGAGVPSTSSAPTGNTYGDTGSTPDTYAVLAAIEQAAQEPAQPAWERQTVAGRYGPIMNYDFGA